MGYSTEQAAAEIIRVASHFLNLRETANNAAWDDPDTAGQDPAGQELRALLESVDWQAGWPYCMAFCKAVYMQAYRNLGAPPAVLRLIAQRFTPSVMLTYRNCGTFSQCRAPAPGAIFFMQKGDSPNGHAGLVVNAGALNFATIEGNTSPSPGSAQADREGDGVYRKVRTLDFTKKPGLWLRGFLVPMSSEEVAALHPLPTPRGAVRRARSGGPGRTRGAAGTFGRSRRPSANGKRRGAARTHGRGATKARGRRHSRPAGRAGVT